MVNLILDSPLKIGHQWINDKSLETTGIILESICSAWFGEFRIKVLEKINKTHLMKS